MIYVHDIIAIAGLAIRVSMAYKDAPDAYQHISEEAATLKLLVDKVAPHFQGTTISQEDYHYGEHVLRDCQSVLEDLDSFIRKHKRLAYINEKLVLNRVKLGKGDITVLHERLISMTVLFNGFVRSCEYMEVQARLTALLGFHGTAYPRISVTSIAAFAANTNPEVAFKQLQKDLYQLGVPEDLIQKKEDKIREILKSQGMVARRQIVSSDTGDKDQELETAYKESCKHLYELGFTEDLIPPKPRVLKILKSRVAVARSVVASQSGGGDKDSTKVLPSFRLSSRVNWFQSGSRAALVPEAADKENSPTLQIPASNSHSIVELLCGKGSSTKFIDQGNNTLLHLAAGGGYTGLVQLLLGNTPPHPAELKGHTGALQLLFDKSASIEAMDGDNNIPLHLAAWNGHADIVDLLLRKGTPIEAIGQLGRTPLHFAALGGHAGTVELLLEKGASIEAININNNTPLHFAASAGHTGTVDLLLRKGASVNAVGQGNSTPLHSAAQDGHTATVELLLGKGASIETLGGTGRTLLHYAALGGHTGMVDLILEKGVSIGALDQEKNSALHLAAWKGHTDVVDLLLRKDASIEAIGQNNMTPLHYAAWGGHAGAVELLLEKGASTEARDKFNNTPLDLAAGKGRTDIVQLLTNKAELARGNHP